MSIDFEALWDALAQYVQNAEMIEDELAEDGEPESLHELAKLAAARRMLEKMDAAVIATAG